MRQSRYPVFLTLSPVSVIFVHDANVIPESTSADFFIAILTLNCDLDIRATVVSNKVMANIFRARELLWTFGALNKLLLMNGPDVIF